MRAGETDERGFIWGSGGGLVIGGGENGEWGRRMKRRRKGKGVSYRIL